MSAMVFSYSAVGRDGKRTTGSVSARDRDEAFQILAQKGLQPFELQAGNAPAPAVEKPKSRSHESSAKTQSDSKEKEGARGSVRLSGKQLVLFTEELSDLLSAGLQLEQALKTMENRGEKSRIQIVAKRLREKVRDGVNFSRALRATSPSFSELYCNLASAGEVSGSLGIMLKRQAEYLSTMNDLRAKVLTAMIYPAFLLTSAVVVTIIFVTFLIPKLTVLMDSTGGDPPLIALALIGASNFLQHFWWLIAAILVGAVFGFQALIKIPANRAVWDRKKLKLPLFGNLQLTRFYVQTLETLANVTGNGLTLLKALELAQGTTQNRYLTKKLQQITYEVGDGASLSRSMDRAEVFPAMLIDLVRVGEQTGKMNEALTKAAARFDKELSRRIEQISAFIQPFIIVLMACLVGVMAYIMLSVIYDTISLLQAR